VPTSAPARPTPPQQQRPRRRFGASGAAGLVVLLSVAGCGRPGVFTLQQPTAPPAQQRLTLVAQSAACASREGRVVCVLGFPLPGRDRPRAFVVYLDLPRAGATVRLHPTDADAGRGLLIQEVGQLAGRTDFSGGWARIRPDRLVRGRYRIELHAYGPCGVVLRGAAEAAEAPRLVRAFEREYAADVAALGPPPPDETTARGDAVLTGAPDQ